MYIYECKHIYGDSNSQPQILAGGAYDGSDGLGGNARKLRRGALGRALPPVYIHIYVHIHIYL